MSGAHASHPSPREATSASASAVKALQAEGRHAEAGRRYAELVGWHQRRASRIAFHLLRDVGEADEAVQEAFLNAYRHLGSCPDDLPFEVWLNRILINGCLDRLRARTRLKRREKSADARARLPECERLIFMLSHDEGYTPPEVSTLTTLNQPAVRALLLRAIRRLRKLQRSVPLPAAQAVQR